MAGTIRWLEVASVENRTVNTMQASKRGLLTRMFALHIKAIKILCSCLHVERQPAGTMATKELITQKVISLEKIQSMVCSDWLCVS